MSVYLAATILRASSALLISSYNSPKRVMKIAYRRPLFAYEVDHSLHLSGHLSRAVHTSTILGVPNRLTLNTRKFGTYAAVRDYLAINKPKFVAYPRVKDLLPKEGKFLEALFSRTSIDFLESFLRCSSR